MSQVGLPPNWWAYTSDDGTYYYNEITQETTWDKPANKPTPAPAPTPAPVASVAASKPGMYMFLNRFSILLLFI